MSQLGGYDLLNPPQPGFLPGPGQPGFNPWADYGRPKTSPFQPFQPEEYQSELSKLGQWGLGGLASLGEMIDKYTGARAVRGLLGGRPRELASVLPGSDVLGITDPTQKVSGEDLLKSAGVLQGEGQKGTFEFRDLLGPAAEMALDPMIYASFGASALGKGGKIAKMIGMAPKTATERVTGTLAGTIGDLADPAARAMKAAQALDAATATGTTASRQVPGVFGRVPGRLALAEPWMNEPLGGLMGLGLPFSDPMAIFGGPEALAGLQSLGKGIGKAARMVPGVGHAMEAAEPLKRAWSAMFEPAVQQTMSPTWQGEARKAWQAKQAAEELTREQMASLGRGLDQALLTPEKMREVRYAAASPMGPWSTDPAIDPVAGKIRAIYDHREKVLADAGFDMGHIDDYVARTAGGIPPKTPTGLEKGLSPFQIRGKSRDPILANIGDRQFDRWVTDPELANSIDAEGKDVAPTLEDKIDRQNKIAKDLGTSDKAVTDALNDWELDQANMEKDPADPALAKAADNSKQLYEQHKAAWDQAGKLQNKVSTLSREERQFIQDTGGYWVDPITDMNTKLAWYDKAKALTDAGHNVLSQFTDGDVPLLKTMEDMGIKKWGQDSVATSQAMRKQAEMRGITYDLADPKSIKAADKALKDVKVPQIMYNDAVRYSKGYTAPEFLKPFLDKWDSMTNAFKTYATAFWPAKYIRDALTGLWQNFVHGVGLDPTAQADALGRTFKGMGHAVNPAEYPFWGKGLTAEQTAQKMIDEELKMNIARTGGGFREAFGGGGQSILDTLAGKPTSLVPEHPSWNPFNIGGVGGRTETQFTPAHFGYGMGNKIFDTNERSAYWTARRQGYSPEGARDLAKKAQFNWDPSELTGFEKGVMRRLVPFYSWARKNVPAQVEQLIQHPGGMVAQAIRMENSLKSQQGFIPEQLHDKLAVPIGEEQDGTQRFFTTTGMPFEDLAKFFGGGREPLTQTGLDLLSETNPLLKMGLEQATGKQFLTGRNLEDLYSQTGSQALDEIIANSPLTRFSTTYRTLTDPRKGLGAKALNLLTGMRVSDIDIEQQRNIEAQRMTEEWLRGKPDIGNIQRFYAKPGAQVTPEEAELLRLQATLEKSFRDRKKAQQAIGIAR
jgi:hypothetical protein